tara:strand:- start:79 stop:234 length:156 start_codon:yes stop_codon:yes gene_type:complete
LITKQGIRKIDHRGGIDQVTLLPNGDAIAEPSIRLKGLARRDDAGQRECER